MRDTVKHFLIPEKGAPINVETAGISICDPGASYERNNPNIVIIEYVFSGEGTLVVDGKKFSVKTDDIYLLPAGVSHEYYADRKNPWAKYFMNVTGNLAQSLLVSFALNNQYVITAPSLKQQFKEVIKTAFAGMPEAIKQSKLTALYVEILFRLRQLSTESQNSSEAVVIKNYLDENYNRVISNKELANQIYRSSDYCLKLFKREFGKTPYEYQMCNKTRIACSLLQHTKKAISEIAEFVGYDNPHYFASMFKNRMGVTPSEYRKKFL